ncbi:carbamoyl-phosphate synthase large subunit [Kiritimatiella glycovorans]|uniref:Carbamoyl phosphate synthase large chain n=1 Tax=Kiritimatiella glycovorans TaxID=1307763 RepID=A0A0G3EFG7_9BACT|nr:carbamoyl-phosphate synthase large subunit [Kiritimatiella glycovorans]AKJ64147.1 Carbamoyl-phosphate synthase large chain [Kiritimatiella glycovorans]
MPKRTDLSHILIIGSGPIIIGQACEFDYSGTQACKALKEEGYKVTLINSNPATIMTDPQTADRTYVEPLTPEAVEKIIERERPDAILPTLGGQTGLNISMTLFKSGVLDKYGVEMIGANPDAIERGEERELFKAAMEEAGIECLKSFHVHSLEEAQRLAEHELGFPIIVRPSYTLGGTGGGIAHDWEQFNRIVENGLKASLSSEVLIEESVFGWKEFEMEVMRDHKDNCVIICSIENMDPMGVHTGDSITVAPAQTLTDREYQVMRDASLRIMRVIGVETGGSNVQFCIHPETGRLAVIEMNPRVSRSSALASKATGFPIAKLAAKLAVGYTLDELPNDITRETPACFEPSIDYCVVKLPRFAFEKFPGAETDLGVSMKSVGETMAIGRNFKESLQKAFRSLEIGVDGLDLKAESRVPRERLDEYLLNTRTERCIAIKCALKDGYSIEKIAEMTHLDPWFIDNIAQIVEMEHALIEVPKGRELDPALLSEAKRIGFSDDQIAALRGEDRWAFREKRKNAGLKPVYHLVDTCAGEFEAYTPYFYSTCDGTLDETRRTDRESVIVLGSGPNRIGQGIEFDYSCVHTVNALREMGYEAIMVNSNPETVSTDYDTSDKLYFEPLTFEDVMNIYENERPLGLIIQMGGQTPLNIALDLLRAGVPILGTSPESIAAAEDRAQFRDLLNRTGLKQPASGTATTMDEALALAHEIGFPVMIRPSYVLGGRAMMIAYDEQDFVTFTYAAFNASAGHPVLIDRFLENAIEVDVDLVCDGSSVYIGGLMEHVEEAGVHSGDSACTIPPNTLKPEMIANIEDACARMAIELNVVGLMNTQIAVKDDDFYVLEVNPRASRTVPYVSKATGVPLANIATQVSLGRSLKELGLAKRAPAPKWYAVKEAVFPFNRFAGVDPILGPEMKSTGEVMGIDRDFETAYWKAEIAAGQQLPTGGAVFLSAKDRDKDWVCEIGRELSELGFSIFATEGTASVLREYGLEVTETYKLASGRKPNIADLMREDKVHLLINTPSGPVSRMDEIRIRSEAVLRNLPIITTESGARATIAAIRTVREGDWSVRALQDYHEEGETEVRDAPQR